MILIDCADGVVRWAVERAARPDEAVVADPDRVQEALARGFPRLFVSDTPRHLGGRVRARVPVLELGPDTVRAWERALRRSEPARSRDAYVSERVGRLVAESALPSTWIDRIFADLARAAGSPLPLPFRTFLRHGLELPTCYTDLGAYAELAGVTSGALKARFRRRGLESPFVYLRWSRVLAVAEALADPEVSIAGAAEALGFTSGPNMCRMVRSVTGVTPGHLREAGRRQALLVRFARLHLTGGRLDRWADLFDLFGRRVA